MPKLSAINTVFDGRKSGYVPPKKLSISPKLKLQKKQVKSIDPITYEVIRHALWHVNEEHGATIRLAGRHVRARFESVDSYRGWRVRLLRAVYAVHVGRHRHPGEMGSR